MGRRAGAAASAPSLRSDMCRSERRSGPVDTGEAVIVRDTNVRGIEIHRVKARTCQVGHVCDPGPIARIEVTAGRSSADRPFGRAMSFGSQYDCPIASHPARADLVAVAQYAVPVQAEIAEYAGVNGAVRPLRSRKTLWGFARGPPRPRSAVDQSTEHCPTWRAWFRSPRSA